uniref:uncharacterized protein LOC113475782 n=1 Tax=Ciona intestinalis TaxID=7719 RepID=UPI000EF55A21|nr:uncharacterized protein LOC113475782 [Ciona intestinalis]XP_026696362.1 uncharacterized protein LOC113475782 [Ciona intestinalis]|eukprot:XP_026696361.1 uncharacterized protein LOC113475782 [Ciona intestinalis]
MMFAVFSLGRYFKMFLMILICAPASLCWSDGAESESKSFNSTLRCSLIDTSPKCKTLRATLFSIYGIPSAEEDDFFMDKFFERYRRSPGSEFIKKASSRFDEIVHRKKVKVYISNEEEKLKLPIEKFKSRWRFYNGRYVELPVCETTASPIDPGPPTTPLPNLKRIILTKQQKEMLLFEHNKARRNVDPTATNMLLKTWDEELEWVAQNKTDSCSFSERNAFHHVGSGKPAIDIVRHSEINAEIGFNWFAWRNTGGLPNSFVTDVMEAWMSEKLYYDYEERTCSSVCRHYLQVIWAETFKLGCTASCCRKYVINGVTWTDTTLLVCAYAPRGNVVDYTSSKATGFSYTTPPKTRHPYKRGKSCYDCGGYLEKGENATVLNATSHNPAFGNTKEPPDTCVDKLCTNTDRDKKIPFKTLPYPTSTTFPWTTTMTAMTTSSPGIPCVKEIEIQIDDGSSVNITIPSSAGPGQRNPSFFVFAFLYWPLSVFLSYFLR